MTGALLLILSSVFLAVVLIAASGRGAEGRRIGIHVPYIGRTAASWTSGHRAARPIVVATCIPSGVLAVLSLAGGPGGGATAAIGWAIWGVGFITAVLVAMGAARRTARRGGGR